MMESPFNPTELMPKEERLAVAIKKGSLIIGLPKEREMEEKRVCLTPDAVAALVANEHKVIVEQGAGEHAHFSDSEYHKAGASIESDPKKVFECPLILKVAPVNDQEIELLKTYSTVISTLNLKSKDLYYINKLQEKKITAIALEELTEHDGSFPFVSSLSEISGLSAIYIAAELMSKSNEGKGQLFGNISGVPPTEIVIFGSGTAAIWAAKTALNLGVSVKIFDNSTSNLRKIQSELKHPIYTSTLQPKNILKALRRCDVAVGAIECHHRTPVVVSQDMVSYMKKGSVIIDISIDRGGCFETSQLTSHQKPTFKKFDVIHYCVPNIPSRYPKTASVSMSNICTPILLDLAENGGIDNALRLDQGLQNGVYLYQGVLTNRSIADQLGLTHTNINFLIF